MDDLDLERMKLEIIKLNGTIAEQDFRVKEKMRDIDRIKKHKAIAVQRQAELEKKVSEIEKRKSAS